MQLYGLIGRKLGHSFSRDFFADKFKREDIDADYLNFEMPSVEDPNYGIMSVISRYPNLCGFNVTIPFKQDILPILDYIDPVAQEIGAVNTVKIDHTDSGLRLSGYNTDIIGFSDSLRPMLEPSVIRKALVLGTGGASHAVVVGLQKLGFDVTLVSRRSAPGILTYDELNRDPDMIKAFGVIVNTTPLGMWPDIDSAPDLPYNHITPQQLLYDAVYNPDPTKFMRIGSQYGAKTCSGIDMLRRQALASWKIWNS